MPLFLAVFAALWIAVMVLAIRAASRPPQCPTCRISAEGVAEEHPAGSPLVVGMTWRCGRCAAVVGRRYLGPLWD
jgi:hypothetical protein